MARAALASDADVELMLVSPRLLETAEGRDLRQQIEARRLSCSETTDALLDSVQDARTAQPVLALVRRREWPDDDGLRTGGAAGPAGGGAPGSSGLPS